MSPTDLAALKLIRTLLASALKGLDALLTPSGTLDTGAFDDGTFDSGNFE